MAEVVSQRSEEIIVAGREAGVTVTSPGTPPARILTTQKRRWGIVLAGGDGTGLHRLTRLVCGDDRPKQFCPLVGDETLLEQTRARTELSISRDQILYSLTRSHQFFYLQECGIRPPQRIVQPADRGTAPPIIHSLLSIEKQDPEALVAVLPCDHHYSDEQAFTKALDSAFKIVAEHPDSTVLLGAPPRGPHVEYGWIELAAAAPNEAFHVRALFDQPSFHVARELFERGSLWNTSVIVGHVRGLLEMAHSALGGIVETIRKGYLWAGSEIQIRDLLYEHIEPADFSRDVLATHTRRLRALRPSAMGWSDLGRPERVVTVLEGVGFYPTWLTEWTNHRRADAGIAPLRSSQSKSSFAVA